MTGQDHTVGESTRDGVAAAPVLAAVWCRSVGTSWTLELHELDTDTAPGAIKDWIPSGVPISHPRPDALAGTLLAERGLYLFRDSSAGPSTRSRRGVGYVCGDAELIILAYLAREVASEAAVHPVVLAAQWAAAGFSAKAAARWVRQGVPLPRVAPNPGSPAPTGWIRS